MPSLPLMPRTAAVRTRLVGSGAARYPCRASQLAAVVKLVYTQASGACGLYARGGSSPLSRIAPTAVATLGARSLPLSSRGLGRRPLTAETGVRIPVAVLQNPALGGGFLVPGRLVGPAVGLRCRARFA